MFLQAEPLGVGDRVMAGLSVAFDALCEEMWLAWRYGACLVPAPRALVKSGIDVGPWLVANDVTVVSTVPTLVALWPTGVAGRRPPADHGRRGVPARARRPAGGARPRGVEHLRPDRGHRRRVRRRADRGGAGPDRAAARRLGPGGGRRPGPAGPRGCDGRADHRRRRAGPLPRPGQGRREVRADADARLGPRLPQRRPGGERPGGSACSAGRADDQVKLGGRRIELGEIDSALLAAARASSAPPRRCARTAAGNQLLVGYVADGRGVRPGAGHGAAPRTRCRPRWCPGWRRSTGCRRGRPARSTGTRCPGRCRPQVEDRRVSVA